MIRLISACVLLAVSCQAVAGGADGIWRTQSNAAGGYLQVTIAPCASNPELTCGTITKAVGKNGEDPNYKNLGREMISNMKPEGQNNYVGGSIWDPEKDKTFKSKMSLDGDDLDVEGCVSFVCTGQHWKRVN
jgi:uncharacterized protein (DUF2147 family)